MKPSDIAALQALSKCYMLRHETVFVESSLCAASWTAELDEDERAFRRYLTNKYKMQLRAIRKNKERR